MRGNARAWRRGMVVVTVGVITVTLGCLLLFVALSLAGVVAGDGRRQW